MKFKVTALAAAAISVMASGAFAGSEPVTPAVSIPSASTIVVPVTQSSSSTVTFFVVTPPAAPGQPFTFQLGRE